MANSETLILKWESYTSYKKVREDDYAWFDPNKPNSNGEGVYIMADSKGVPLYIGMAFGKWGFADRYNAWGFLDAAIEHSGNLIFFAEVKSKSLCKEVETQLLWQEKPKFNEKKIHKPQRSIDIKHEGKVPSFHFTPEMK